MKSAYELAMEKLEQSAPSVKLTDEARAQLADIDEKFRAKIAERELFLDDLIAKATSEGRISELPEISEQKTREIAKLERQREEAKEKLRLELG